MSSRYVSGSTDHADRMLRIRGSGPTASVIGSWNRGLRVEVPDVAPVPRHDEARYDAQSAVVVFRREDTLTTVYGLAPDHLTNIHGVAVAAAVDAQFGTAYRTGIDVANLEEINR
ncbi:hypothetical protein [Halorubrum sp. AS12]|uniref:hypothetical protein n=1 Tax=Halorubrum sp. AS12 TaxID=3409687 RepID=UPI003DA77F77